MSHFRFYTSVVSYNFTLDASKGVSLPIKAISSQNCNLHRNVHYTIGPLQEPIYYEDLVLLELVLLNANHEYETFIHVILIKIFSRAL